MQAGGEIEKLTSPETAGEPDATVAVKKSGMAEMVYGRTPEFVFSTVLLLILLYFLLAYDEVFLTKLIKLMPRLEDKKTRGLDRTSDRVPRLALSAHNHIN